MAGDPIVVISFKDLEADEDVRERVQARCRALHEEFPELNRCEVTFAGDGAGHTANVRVSGAHVLLDAHGSAMELEYAADGAFEKIHHQLRTVHDKRIFTRRREARKASPKPGRSQP
jgi:ribosome-associated translation inhibitor RaiA